MEKKKLTKENDYQVGSGASFTCAAFGSEKWQLIAAGDDQNNIMMWRVTKVKPKMILTGQSKPAQCLTFSSDALKLYSGTQGGTVHVWDLESEKELIKLKGHMTACTTMCTNDNVLVTGSLDTKVKFWDLRSNTCQATFREHSDKITSVRLSPDGKWVASGSEDGRLKIWDVTANKILADFK